MPDTREQFYSPELKATFVIDLMVALTVHPSDAISTYLRDIDLCSDSSTEVLRHWNDADWSFVKGVSRGERTGYVELGLCRNTSVCTDFLVYTFYYEDG